MSNRNNQKQIWADESFVDRLEKIKAKRVLSGNPIKNTGELTKLITETEAFQKIEEEILKVGQLNNKKKNNLRLNINFDGLL